MINVIDHASTYRRMFLAMTKYQAAKMFEKFLLHS